MTTFIDQLKAIVGDGGWITDSNDLQPYVTEWRGMYEGRTPILLRPRALHEIVAIVEACAREGVAMVPQGGNTGMCAAAIPDSSGDQVILSLGRMNRIRSVDAANFSMAVDAGCVLTDVQEAASAVGRHFPLSLGAEGSCQIGGNIATNAGGINVLRYGKRAIARPWPRSRPGRRSCTRYDASASQGQHRLRSQAALHRQRRDAWHHHRRNVEVISRNR